MSWNEIKHRCKNGLKCVDQGPDSQNVDYFSGLGICEDPQKLGDIFDLCDTVLEWSGERIAGCIEDFECREFEFLGRS